MIQYHDLLRKILAEGREKGSARDNMPPTLGVSDGRIKMDLFEGFPLLTTKKMAWKSIIHELLWFLRGETNIKYLVDNDINIWNGDAYRWYLKRFNELKNQEDIEPCSMEEFIEKVKDGRYSFQDYKMGDLGKIYGYQWRNHNGVDQVRDVIEGLRNNPYSRYHIIDSWNKSDFREMALPPCHLLYQFIVRPFNENDKIDFLNKYFLMYDQVPWTLEMLKNQKDVDEQFNIPKFYLDLNMYQRSCDTFLGVPFNLASMSLLCMIIAKTVKMEPGIALWLGGDVHIYLDHIPLVKKQLERTPHRLPQMFIKKDLNSITDIEALTIEDFVLSQYSHDDAIKGELFTGYITKHT
jgi:thymidylate synthase